MLVIAVEAGVSPAGHPYLAAGTAAITDSTAAHQDRHFLRRE